VLKGLEITNVGGHVGGCPGVEVPLSSLRAGGWNAHPGQRGEHGLVVPYVSRSGRGRCANGWSRRTSEEGLIGQSARAGAKDACAKNAEWHLLGLNHARPRVQAGRPGGSRRVGAELEGGPPRR
jgi:hypothetical protein